LTIQFMQADINW